MYGPCVCSCYYRTWLLITLKGIIHIRFERQIITHRTHTQQRPSSGGGDKPGTGPNYSLLRQATAALDLYTL